MIKNNDLRVNSVLKPFIILLTIFISAFFLPQQALALPTLDQSSPAVTAALKLVRLCAESQTSIDAGAIEPLVKYVLESKPAKDAGLPQIKNAVGAYHEYDTRIDFASFLQYSFTSQVPSVITSPASLRSSVWKGLSANPQKLPTSWKPAAPDAKPLIFHGTQHDAITPDQTTGVYYDYDLKKTLILCNSGGRQVLISISKQMDVSNVGKKGFILGNDDDWNYHYTDEIGSARTGLGWVKSYIYDYFAVAVYIENMSSPATVRSGVFQWIRAGWSGINFAKTEHVISGMKRYSRNSNFILESPNLPAPKQIATTYKHLSNLSHKELVEKYAALLQARLALALSGGKIKSSEKKAAAAMSESKEQMVEALMLEYLKIALGKPSLVGKQIITGAN